jgi:hypothetical protein
MNTHSSFFFNQKEIPDKTGENFTPEDEGYLRMYNLLRIRENKLLSAVLDTLVRMVFFKQKDGFFIWSDLFKLGFKEIQVQFKSRKNRFNGNFVVNPAMPPSTWLVYYIDEFVFIVRKAAAGDTQQIVLEVYPKQEDNDYYLGVCIGKLRLNEDNKLEIGPCGPYPQHCVSNKSDGDAAMSLFHFPAKWD